MMLLRYLHCCISWHCIRIRCVSQSFIVVEHLQTCPIVSKKTSRHWIVIGAISLSYIGYSTDALLVWYLTQNEFVNDSETRETLFLSQLVIPAWLTLVNDIIVFGMAAMADSILVSRATMVVPFLAEVRLTIDLALL